MKQTIKDIREFVEQDSPGRFARRKHFESDEFVVYLRVTSRIIEGKMTPTIDIGTIEVFEEKQGQGIFSRLLKNIETIADRNGRTVFVESIINPDLTRSLVKRGYALSGDDFSPNAFRIKGHSGPSADY